MSHSPSGSYLKKSLILVVDDEETNRILLRDVLEADEYVVSEAANGPEALEMIGEHLPDTILLDIMMPGPDGIEICRRLKADPRTAPVPVILVTAKHLREERLSGIAAGAVDFLTKPVDLTDLRLRVRNAIRSKHLYDEVQEKYRHVQRLEELRDSLVHMIVHDLRSPLTAIQSGIELLKLEVDGTLDDEVMQCLRDTLTSTDQVTQMIGSMLDVNRMESGQMPLSLGDIEMHALVRDAVATLGSRSKRVHVEKGDPSTHLWAAADADVVRRVLVNLVSNALEYSPQELPVTVAIEGRDGAVRVAVSDRGPGVPEDFKMRVFEKFGQVTGRKKNQGRSTGLGLAFCKLAVEAHNGRIGVESEEGSGATFWFELPLREREPGSTQDATQHKPTAGGNQAVLPPFHRSITVPKRSDRSVSPHAGPVGEGAA